uniref:Uncharacterized protein n=1 Tax=Pyropia pulchra TaxID=60925 RepID=O24674_9RHOD|nr:ORF7 [Pyropia pulchra]
MVIPSLKQSGLYVEGDPQVFSIITSDDKRTNYRLTARNPEGVVIIKSKSDDDLGDSEDRDRRNINQINIYATINTNRFNEIIDPSIGDEKSLDETRIVSLSDISLLSVMKVLVKRPEYSKLVNPFSSERNVEDLSQILAFINKANQIREGLQDIGEEEASKIETLINSSKFKSEHKASMKDLKIHGSILTSQKMRDQLNNLFRSVPAPKTPRFMSR